MKVGKTLILILFFSVMIAPSSKAQVEGQLATFGANMAVSNVVQNLRDTIEGIITSLEMSVGNSLFSSRQHLELLLSQVEISADGLLEKSFDELDSTRQQFFVDVKNQLDALSRLEEVTAKHVEQTTAALSHAIVNLPLAKTYPIVLKYDPLYVPSGGPPNNDNIIVGISGVLLSSHEPFLVINSQRCERSGKIDTSLTFLCNKNLFLAEDRLETITGKLYVYEKLGFWDAIFGSDPKEYNYDISINVIPTRLGKAVTSVTTQSTTLRRESRSQDFGHRNNHCQGSIHLVFPFNAKERWKIDPASIRASCRNSRRSSCNGVRNITEHSFGYSCSIANSGTCGPTLPFGRGRLWRDARGSCGGSVEWQEVKATESLAETVLDAVDLEWGKDNTIRLPDGTRSIQISVDKVDGTRRVVTNSEESDPWFDVEVNLENRLVVIRPAQLGEAMQ